MTTTAKIVADSVSDAGVRITTMQLRYPRYIHAEFMTHRQFSRNASSSRAIPVQKMLDTIEADPVMPKHWGKNQKGMQARKQNDALVYPEGGDAECTREEAWHWAMAHAMDAAAAFDRSGYHKQIVNRLIEPFSHINVVVTSTEWSNFYALRRHPDAAPEIQELAEAMHAAHADSVPQEKMINEWHLPYVSQDDLDIIADAEFAHDVYIDARKVSAARCARVSYLTHDGKKPDLQADLKLFDRLAGAAPLHASPLEHQACPDEREGYRSSAICDPFTGDVRHVTSDLWHRQHLHGNFRGWCQFRKFLTGECQ